jgi:hypothetical protein
MGVVNITKARQTRVKRVKGTVSPRGVQDARRHRTTAKPLQTTIPTARA